MTMTIAEQRAQLEARGYVEVPEYGGIRPGVRIRHRGHQWAEAYRDGTATVVAVYERPDSSWSRTWRMADVEVVHQADDVPVGWCPATWAQYHLEVVVPWVPARDLPPAAPVDCDHRWDGMMGVDGRDMWQSCTRCPAERDPATGQVWPNGWTSSATTTATTGTGQ